MSPSELLKLYCGLLVSGILPFFINGALNPVLHPHPLLYWSFEFFAWLFLPAVVFGLAVRKGGLKLSELGLTGNIRGRRRIGWLLVLCVVAGPVDLQIYFNAKIFFDDLFPSKPLFDYKSVVPDAGILRAVVVVYLGITAGVVEELYFRGFCARISELLSYPRAVYVVGSSLLFGLIHWEGGPSAVLATFTLGLTSALIFLAIRNLWPLIVGHAYTDIYWYW